MTDTDDARDHKALLYLTSTPKKGTPNKLRCKVESRPLSKNELFVDPLISSIDEGDSLETGTTATTSTYRYDDDTNQPNSLMQSESTILVKPMTETSDTCLLNNSIINQTEKLNYENKHPCYCLPVNSKLKDRVRQRLFDLVNTLDEHDGSKNEICNTSHFSMKSIVPCNHGSTRCKSNSSLLNRSTDALTLLLENQLRNIVQNEEVCGEKISCLIHQKNESLNNFEDKLQNAIKIINELENEKQETEQAHQNEIIEMHKKLDSSSSILKRVTSVAQAKMASSENLYVNEIKKLQTQLSAIQVQKEDIYKNAMIEKEDLSLVNTKLMQQLTELQSKLTSLEKEKEDELSQVVIERDNAVQEAELHRCEILKLKNELYSIKTNYQEVSKNLQEMQTTKLDLDKESDEKLNTISQLTNSIEILNMKMNNLSQENAALIKEVNNEKRKLSPMKERLLMSRKEVYKLQNDQKLTLNILPEYDDDEEHSTGWDGYRMMKFKIKQMEEEEKELRIQLKLCSQLLTDKDESLKQLIEDYEYQLDANHKHNKAQILEYKKAIRILKDRLRPLG